MLVLVFVEVKLRRGTIGHPLGAVTSQKQARIRLIAEHYLAEEEFASGFEEVPFDVIGILLAAGKMEVRYVKDAF